MYGDTLEAVAASDVCLACLLHEHFDGLAAYAYDVDACVHACAVACGDACHATAVDGVDFGAFVAVDAYHAVFDFDLPGVFSFHAGDAHRFQFLFR